MIDSGASHTFVAESVVESHSWLVASIEPKSSLLATGSEIVSDLICTVPIVFCDIGGHAVTQHITCYIMKTYHMI